MSAIEVARICLVLIGCLAAAWAAGFAMVYRRGVNAGMIGDIFNADHRIKAE